MKDCRLRTSTLMLMLFFLACAVNGWAKSEWYQDEVREINGIRAAISKGIIGLPPQISARNEVLVVITAGASYTDVKVLATGLPQYKLESCLKNAIRSAGLPDGALMSDWVREFFVARILVAHPHYGKRSAENTVPVGRILAGLRSQGLKPHALLRIPSYASVSSLKVPRIERSKYTWYNVTTADKAYVVSMKAVMSPGLLTLLVWLRFVLPFIGFAGFFVGLVLGVNRRLPLKKRLAYFDWLGLILPMALGFSGVTAFSAFMHSSYAFVVADMWFANPAAPAILFWQSLSLCGVLFLPLPLFGMFIRWAIFRKLDNEPNVVDLAGLLDHWKKHTLAVALLLAALVIYLIIVQPIEFEFRRLGSSGGMIFMFPLYWFIMSRMGTEMLRPNRAHSDLTQRAKELAQLMGVKLNEVRVATGKAAQTDANACALAGKKTIIVTQKAADSLTPAEMDWLLAHELAHFADYGAHSRLMFLNRFLGVLFALCVWAMFSFGYIKALPVIWLAALIPVGLLLLVVDIGEIQHRLEYEADLKAYLAIGDLDAAIASLTAITEKSKCKMDGEELDYHPKTIKRIKALKMAAERMEMTL